MNRPATTEKEKPPTEARGRDQRSTRMWCDECLKMVPSRYAPSPDAGPHWRCSECGEVTTHILSPMERSGRCCAKSPQGLTCGKPAGHDGQHETRHRGSVTRWPTTTVKEGSEEWTEDDATLDAMRGLKSPATTGERNGREGGSDGDGLQKAARCVGHLTGKKTENLS